MPSNKYLFFFCFLLLLFLSPSIAQSSFRPKALILPVIKDSSTLQYVTQIKQRTPLVPVKLSVHLGGQTLWVDCERGYVSSTYKPAVCGSPECSIAKSHSCGNCTSTPTIGCSNNACYNVPENPAINTSYSGGEIAQDVISIQSTDGSNPGPFVTLPRFIFTCVPSFLAEGLANGVKGTAGLGKSAIALPSQFAQAFGFPRKFAICLSSSTKSNGVVILGDGPYNMLPGIDISKNLIYTPLIANPALGTGANPFLNETSSEYFIKVREIKINGKAVKINKKLLNINKDGFGGTKISSGKPYTLLETSIYNAVTEAFIKEMSNVTRVGSVGPFGVCFSSKNIGRTRAGPAVPPIDLVLQSKRVFWRIFGANSMIQVKKDVMCLAILDAGTRLDTPVVIGGYQIEDNLLQFDIANSVLGFSSSLLFRQTTCANFNFTSHA